MQEGRGARHKRRPTTMDGLVSPEPRMAGGDLGAMSAAHSAGQGWPSVPVAKDGEKGPCAPPRRMKALLSQV